MSFFPALPIFTWGNKPAASSVTPGTTIRISDVGLPSGMVVTSNGAVWVAAGVQPLAQSGVPVILPSSGSSNATGQITLATALPYTPGGTVQIYLPAGVVTAGSQGVGAGFYTVGFSTAAIAQIQGSGIVTANASYAQDTSEVALSTVVVPAGALGLNGALRPWTTWTVPNNANNKVARIRLGGIAGTAFLQYTNPSIANYSDVRIIRNRGSQALQVGSFGATAGNAFGITTGSAPYGTVDTSQAQSLVISGQLATATDYIILEASTIELLPG